MARGVGDIDDGATVPQVVFTAYLSRCLLTAGKKTWFLKIFLSFFRFSKVFSGF